MIDTLGGILGIKGRVHGHVVATKSDTLIIRTDDDRTVPVDASQTDARIRGLLKPGDGVTITLKESRDGGSRDQALVASSLELDPASQAPKSYQRVAGTVTEATRERVTFKTREGFTLPLDVTSIQGLPPLSAGQPATLTYEQGARQGIVAIWIEPGTGASASSAPSASVDTARAAQRVHGLVESVSMSGFTLSTDDGRKLSIETSRAGQNVRPGDLVTVVGRRGDRADTMIADSVQPDARQR